MNPSARYEALLQHLENLQEMSRYARPALPKCTCDESQFACLTCPVPEHRAEAEKNVLEDLDVPLKEECYSYCDYCGNFADTLVTAYFGHYRAGQLWECNRCYDIGKGEPYREPWRLRLLRWLASL